MVLVPVSEGDEAEKNAQNWLADNLPPEWIVTTNVTEVNFDAIDEEKEVDSVVLCPHGIFVLDFKNWSGTVIPSVGGKWKQVKPKSTKEHKNAFMQVRKAMFAIKDLITTRDKRFADSKFCNNLVVLTYRECNLNWASDVPAKTRHRIAFLDEVKDRICAIHPTPLWELDARLVRKALEALNPQFMPDDALASWPIRPQRSEIVEGVVRTVDNRGVIVELHGIDQGVLPDGGFEGNLVALPNGGFEGSLEPRMQIPQSGLDGIKVGQHVRAKVIDIKAEVIDIKSKITLVLHRKGDPLHKLQAEAHVTGRVTHIFDDHALVDLGGIFATLDVSEVSWAQWQDPMRLLGVGWKRTVKIIDIDRATRKIAVSLRQTQPDPLLALKSKIGARVTGKVNNISAKGSVAVNLGGIFGWIAATELSNSIETIRVGQDIEVKVLSIDEVGRLITVSRKQALLGRCEDFIREHPPDSEVDGVITAKTIDGAVVNLGGGVEGWLDASEIDWVQLYQPTDLLRIGQEVTVKVIRIDRATQKITVSRRQTQTDPLLRLKVDDLIKGTIERVFPDGVMSVNLGGIFGMLPAAELSRAALGLSEDATPHETVEAGQNIAVQIFDIDEESRIISVSHKLALLSGCEVYIREHPPGSEVDGVITAKTSDGAVVNLDGGVQGQIDVSEIDWALLSRSADAFGIGQQIKVTVIGVDSAACRVAVSHELALPGGCEAFTRGYPPSEADGIVSSRTADGVTADLGGDVDRDRIERIRSIKLAAEQGVAEAQVELADLYREGREGMPKSSLEAARWYEKAAAQGNVDAQYRLGRLSSDCWAGYVPEDAGIWFEKAALQGHADAQKHLADLHMFGRGGVTCDIKKAVHLYQSVAAADHGLGQYRTGACFFSSAGIRQSNLDAATWFREVAAPKSVAIAQSFRSAAAAGGALAQNDLGWLYEAGCGVSQDHCQAREWYLKSAMQGHPLGQRSLGRALVVGLGGKTDVAAGVGWYHKAAEQGDITAQWLLGHSYLAGIGVIAVDRETAAHWFRQAASQGHEQSRKMLVELGAS